ncbi:hypothetical protein [Gottfriedia solisilvae]|uniref:hypothetical protein n=1 Tax=Gottfriedia solisilvae TaxID=1516104 RepID=UPI003D2F05F8
MFKLNNIDVQKYCNLDESEIKNLKERIEVYISELNEIVESDKRYTSNNKYIEMKFEFFGFTRALSFIGILVDFK